MPDNNILLLEIFKKDYQLAMSLFQQDELASTLRHYSQISVSFDEINKFCREIISALNRAASSGALEAESFDSLKKTGQLLWDHLLTRQVKEKLAAAPISDLVLSLDEELINIPWELLYTGKDFLSLKFNLGRLVRTKAQRTSAQYRSFSRTPRMLILANPTNDLKSAYLEGLYIKNQFDKKRKDIGINFKSTYIDTLYVKKNLRDYDIVHFAGHCEYDLGRPENSGWVLSDGKFTAQDIRALGETLSLPTLIFSNACHSAGFTDKPLGADYQQQAYSLAAAFLFSGVRHYIGTIRKIEDPASLSFAREFYGCLISGRPVGESLRISRLKLIQEQGAAALSWASYILYGDPSFTLFKIRPKPSSGGWKPNVRRYKKQLAWLSLAVAVACVFIYLYIRLPTANPSAYLLSLQAQKLFLTGNNQQVIILADRIIQKDPLFLAAYPLLANTYQRLGDKKNTLKYYFDYLRYSEKKQDKKNLAAAYTGTGWAYHLQGDYAKALDFYNRALALARENNDKLNEADVLGKLAVWHMDKNDNDKALELLTRSSKINLERQESYKHRYNLACDYFNLGLVFTNKDDFASAEEFYDKSFNLFDKLRLKYELSDYYFNMGEIYSFRKEYFKAIDFYNKGLKMDNQLGNKFNLASDYNMFGELYMEMENWLEAEKYFNEALVLSAQLDAQPELADACYNLGLLYKRKNQKNKAREYLHRAQEIYRSLNSPKYQEAKEKILGLDKH
ncbi:MAG: tetratricopeptide repeat protein [Candidatus Omnitrophica bacterium]|nr:tetratricopeptide repeat protein [Candidatus Omnitrophota bacterium]